MLKEKVDAMFEDAGKKIKGNVKATMRGAIILLVIAVVVAEIGGFVLLIGGEEAGFTLILFSPLVALILGYMIWRGLLLEYGFGETVDTAIVNRKEEITVVTTEHKTIPDIMQKTNQSADLKEDEIVFWVCDCGMKNNEINSVCRGCKKTRPSKANISGYTKCICGAMVKKNQACPLCGREVW